MLERQRLWLGPWEEAPPPEGGGVATRAATRARAVHDPADGERLGVVRRHAGTEWPLLRLVARQVFGVYETEDESLLCTVRRPWGVACFWEVCDAEGRRVAQACGDVVLDAAGRPLAAVEPHEGGGAVVRHDGVELGAFRHEGGGLAVTFRPVTEHEPFARMALLGAVLARHA
jgi:hypothetical protein